MSSLQLVLVLAVLKNTSNSSLMLSLQIRHISLQFHEAFGDNFDTADSSRGVIKPARWKYLATHNREYHLNDKKIKIDGSKTRED